MQQAIRAEYITQYANSLIGRQLKTISQTAVFHVHGIVNDNMMAVWKAVGTLTSLIWFTEIREPEEYLVYYYKFYFIWRNLKTFSRLILMLLLQMCRMPLHP
jgi:hypothetical protein